MGVKLKGSGIHWHPTGEEEKEPREVAILDLFSSSAIHHSIVFKVAWLNQCGAWAAVDYYLVRSKPH